MMRWPIKDPADVLDYQINWTDLLDGDTIATSVWTVPVGFTTVSTSNTTTTATVWLSGGTVGVHQVTNTVTTSGARTYERSVQLAVEQL